MKIFAIIPARSGSKRFPDKNFASLYNGTSLIQNTVNKLLKSKVDKIYISSNNIEYVKEKCEYHPLINLVHRPDEFATDESKAEDVIFHTISEIEKEFGTDDAIIVYTQVTSPTWRYTSLYKALEIFNSNSKKVSTLISISDNYQPNGCFYIFNKNRFKKTKKLYDEDIFLLKLLKEELIDIDYEYQLHLANAILSDAYL